MKLSLVFANDPEFDGFVPINARLTRKFPKVVVQNCVFNCFQPDHLERVGTVS
jgi:hypothetical protein